MKRVALLLVLLLLAGCIRAPQAGGPVVAPTRPSAVYKPVDPTLLQYEQQDLVAAERVAHVTVRQGRGLLSYARPLWGDREEDRPKIAHILRLIRLARSADSPAGSREGLDDEHETLMTVRYADGHQVQVGLAYQRLATGAHQSIQGRMYIPGVGEVIAPELDQFYRGVATVRRIDLLVPVSVLIAPRQVQSGSTVTIQGDGWVEVARIAIFLLDGGTKHRQLLGEVPVERGVFSWQGALPPDVAGPRWQYAIALEVAGTELYRTPIEITAP